MPIDITPFARFRFDYRSLDMLRIDGVAPPEPAPAAAAAGPSGAQAKPQIKAEPTSRKRPSEADTKPDTGAKKKRVVIEVRCDARVRSDSPDRLGLSWARPRPNLPVGARGCCSA